MYQSLPPRCTLHLVPLNVENRLYNITYRNYIYTLKSSTKETRKIHRIVYHNYGDFLFGAVNAIQAIRIIAKISPTMTT